MALSIHDPYQAGRRGRRARRSALSEINVTPLVDVMLVLLIIFMISAPLQDQNEPLTISIRSDGSVFLNQTPVQFSALSPALHDMVGAGMTRPIYVRADGRASYAAVAQVMAAVSASGFSNINLITDTGGPSSGAKATPTHLGQAGAP
jgi:biopolymer transport protein TolR